jgi:multiple sugar transport system substrate-binding protein
MNHRLIVAFGLTALSLGALGVAQNAKKTITVASWAGNDKLIQAVLAGFTTANPEIEVKVVGGLGYGDYHPALNNKLQAGNAEDVISVGGQFMAEYADSSFLVDLKKAPFVADAKMRAGFVASQIALATGAKGNLAAVPNDAPPAVTYYRRDALEKAGLKIADITSSWEKYIEAGKKLKTMGVFITGEATDVAATVMTANIPRGEGVYFDKAGKPLVDNARFIKAFSLAKQIRDLGIESRLPGWSAEWFEGFKSGKVATITVGSWFENILTDTIHKDGAGKWGVALAPEKSVTVAGGAFYAIPSSSKNKAEAWALTKYLTSPAVQAEVFRQSGNFPANLATLKDPVFNEASAYFGGQKIRQVYAEAARRMTAVLPSKNYALAESIVQDALKQVLEQGKDIKTALADAKTLIERRTSR